MDGLFQLLVGMVEVTDSESDSTGVVWLGKVSLGEYLVFKTMVETNFR